MFNFYDREDSEFELTLCVRDHAGNYTGKKKTYKTDSPYKLWLFFNRFQGRPKRRRKKVKPNEKPNESTTEE